MKRENRYLVIKRKDVERSLNDDEKITLSVLCDKIENSRLDNGSQPINCLVIESDWPEYEPVWKAIEKRIDKEGKNETS